MHASLQCVIKPVHNNKAAIAAAFTTIATTSIGLTEQCCTSYIKYCYYYNFKLISITMTTVVIVVDAAATVIKITTTTTTTYTVRHKELHHFVFAITLSYLSLFEYLLVHIYRDKFGTN